jgi:hypothetical protein
MHILCIRSGRLREDIEDSLEVKNLETRSMRKTELEIKKELARIDILQLKESELKESIDAHKYE